MANGSTTEEHQSKWITISIEEYESMQRTIEVLSDKGLMEQLKESSKDKKTGKIGQFEEFAKEIGI
jgi:PHD/YefM family antitoxin component YafN of YafNO toxin-antitoxin module